jgi:hypothetical protein
MKHNKSVAAEKIPAAGGPKTNAIKAETKWTEKEVEE